MLLSDLPITPEMLTQYVNYAVIAIMVLCALIGFARGTFKSVFYMIATLVVFIGGFLLMNVITDLLINVDLSSFNLSYNLDSNTYTVSTIKEMLVNIIQLKLFGEGVDVSNTVTLTVLVSIAEMLVKVAYAIILIVIAFTVFKLIADIIWLIVRPSKTKKVKEKVKDKKGKEKVKVKEEKKKVSILSRLLGAGVGAIKGALYTLLIFFLVAGLSSIAESVELLNTEASADTTYNVVIANDSLTLVSYSEIDEEENSGSSLSDTIKEYQDYLDLLTAYRDTIPGQVFGTIKIGDAKLDEYVFDSIISANGKDENISYNIKLRKELKQVIEAINECPELLSSNLSMETLASMDKDKLRNVVDKLSSLELVKVVMPVALEVVIVGNVLDSKIPEDMLSTIKSLNIDELRSLDYTEDIKNLGYVFVDVTSILTQDEDGNYKFDFVSMPSDVVDSIFESLGSLNIVDVIAPIAVTYVLSMDSVKTKLDELGIDVDSLGLDEVSDWGDEVTKIGKIYSAFTELGLTTDDIKNMDLSNVDMDKIDGLTEAIFNSIIIKNSVPVIVDYALSILPEEYEDLITIPEDVDWKEELNPLLKATVTLLSCDILDDSDPDKTMVDKLSAIPDDKIEDLGLYLSSSSIIRNNLNNLIDTLMKPDEDGNSPLGGITLTGLDSSDDWNQGEITSLFKSVKAIINCGLLDNGSDYINTLGSLDNETLDSLALNLSSSKFFKRNFSSVIDYLMDSLDEDDTLELTSLSEDQWTNTELGSVLYTVREIANSGLLDDKGTDGIKDLTNETIDDLGTYISSSKFFTTNLTPLMDWLLKDVDMGDIHIVGFTNSEDWTKAEIVGLLKSARLIVTYQDDLTQLVKLSEDDLDVLLSSKLITNVLVDFIKEYSKEGQSLEIVEGADLISDDEWNDTYLDNVSFTYNDGLINITKPTDFKADKYYIYVKDDNGNYNKVTSTSTLTCDLAIVLGTIPNESDVLVKANKFGEIRNMFVAVKTIVGDADTIDSNKILSNLTSLTDSGIETILKSRIVSETIICQIEKYASGEDAFISIPEGDLTLTDADGNKDRSAWLSSEGDKGELFKALKAITVVFKGVDLSSSVTFNTDMITNINDSDIDTITDSAIINETLIFQVEKFAKGDSPTIYIPSEYKNADNSINRTNWNNNSETKNILVALKAVFNGGSIDTTNLKLKPIIDSKDNILKSLVLVETIKQNILKVDGINVPNDDSLSSTDLTGWKNTYDSDGNVLQRGEISNLLSSVSYAIVLNDDTTISSINTDSIKISNVILNSDEVLKSLIISETIRCKLTSVSGINIPTNEGLSTSDLTGWKNTYNTDGSVKTKGEISNMLGAINAILSINDDTNISTLDASSIKLNKVIDNKNEVLKSLVISETIRTKITAISSINIPANEGLSDTDLTGWKNTYNSDGSIKEEGELSKLLSSVSAILNINDDTTVENINADSIKISKVITSSDTVLKSLVISETIRCKLTSVSGINIPTNEGLSTSDLTGWKNTYNTDGSVKTKGEISNMLSAINAILTINDDTDISSLNADSIKLNKVITNKNITLKSLVISETIRCKLINITSINIPTNEGLLDTDLTGWKNTYKENGDVDSEGEISKLLTSVGVILDIDDDTTIESIDADSIKISKVITNSDTVLKSLVISETIRCKLTSITGISIPANEGLSTTGLDGWKNTYNTDGTVNTKGEISNLLNSINIIINVSDSTTLTSFDMNSIKLKKVIDNSDTLLKSLVIAETIRVKVSANSVVSIPSTLSSTDLTGWKNTYNTNEVLTNKGELSYLLSSLGVIINPSDDTGLDSFSMDIKLSTVIDNKDDLLHSLVITETIKKQIIDNSEKSGAVINLPESYNDSSSNNYINWSNTYIDSFNTDTNKVEYSLTSRGEIDRMLDGVSMILTNTDTTLDNVTSFDFSAIFDSTKQATIIKSKVISETIITKLEGMSTTLYIPTGVGFDNKADRTNWWKDNGELKYFLNGVSSLLTDDQKKNLSTIDLDIDSVYSTIIDETSRTKLLSSYVISETLTVNFADLSILKVSTITESNSGVDLSLSSSHSSWYVINSDKTIEHKELWNLITSIRLLVGDTFNTSEDITIDKLLNNPSFVPTLDSNKYNTNTTVYTFLQSKVIENLFVGLVQDIVINGDMKTYLNSPSGGYLWYYKQYSESTLEGKEYDLQTILESIYMMTSAGLSYNMTFNLATLDIDKVSDAYVISRTFRSSIEKTFNTLLSDTYSAAYTYSVFKGSPIATWDSVKLVQADYDEPKTRLEAQNLLVTNLTTIKTNVLSVA